MGLNELFAALQCITSFILNIFCMNLSEGFPAMFFEFTPQAPLQIHAAMLALDSFQEQNGRLPNIG